MIEPVITKQSLFRQVRSKIDEISEVFYQMNFHSLEPGLMAGKSGIILFLVNHAKIFRCEESAELAFKMLNSTIEDVYNKHETFTFSDGLAGIGWLLTHLVKYDMIEFDADNGLEDIDKPLAQMMKLDLAQGNYDLLYGGIGYGMYFLGRYAQDKNPEYLRNAIDGLEQISLDDKKGGIYWETDIHLEKVIHGINLGMAHGMPGIIAFLSKLQELGIEKERCIRLLDGAMYFLLTCKQDPSHYRSCFPNWISKGSPAPSRLAWCYGDPGVGLAFLHAAEAAEYKPWEKEYNKLFKTNSSRRSLKDDYILDAGLCHGSAGLAQVFNHIFQKTKDQEFQETAAFWILKTMEMANHRDGLAGFKAYRPPKSGDWTSEAGLLEGLAGIGLALMTAVSNEDTEWDACLMIH